MSASRGSLAYDTSKAAANHLVRELAIDLALLVRVNGVAPATVARVDDVPRDRVIASLVKYRIPFDENADTESPAPLWPASTPSRTLTKSPITPEDQAESIFFLVSDRSAKTTGQVLSVDGGLAEASR